MGPTYRHHKHPYASGTFGMPRFPLLVLLLLLFVSVASATTIAQVGTTAPATTTAVTTSAPPACEAKPLPSSYTRNTRYVMLTGFCAFLLGAIALYLLGAFESGNKVVHSLSFLFLAGICLAYFSLWEGLGSFYREDPSGCSLITFGRWIGILFTLPLVATTFTIFSRVERNTIVGAAGATMFCIFCWFMGAAIAPATKYVWWVGGVLFAILSCGQFFAIAQGSSRSLSPSGATAANACFMVLSMSMLGYAVIWVIGATGTGYLQASTEMALYALFDVLSHLAVALIMVASGESVQDSESQMPLLNGSPSYGQPAAAYGSYAPAAISPSGQQTGSRQFV